MKYLEIKNLNISFFKNPVLNNINFELHAGQRIGIVGQNGSGKTTLVETIMGVNDPKVEGELTYFNDIENHMKAVFQEYQYERTFNLGQIYKIYSQISLVKPRDDIKKMFSEYGLEGMHRRYFHRLSGGQKQKFKLMMCLELKPKLLILDEVTTSLDFLWRQEILKIIKNYLNENPECALILVSHDYAELFHLTDQQFLIQNGSMLPITNLDKYFKDYQLQLNALK